MDRPVAIVTGAANNIGRAIAEELASSHALVLVDRADASGVARRLPQAVAVEADVCNGDDCARAVAAAQRLGPLKALVQNTWCEIIFDGAAWKLMKYGAL